MQAITSWLPKWVKEPLKRVFYYGNGRFCPICGKSSRRFQHFGKVPRKDAMCPNCNSLERHRLLWLYLSRKTDLFDGKPKKMLHVAPEQCLEPKFKELLGDSYLTADLFNPRAMIKMDITDINYGDQSFDVIYCSHVLEHVLDDKKAMREFFRVLKNDGWAILLAPISAEKTLEDPAIVEPEERLKIFGQEDHVRLYGPDYADRLREAGFKVKITGVDDLVQEGEATRMGLTQTSGEIYFCTK
jgi:SAM-dependent methyltransferase